MTPSHKPQWQTYASAIASGVLGDWLSERKNPLAVRTGLYQHGRPVVLERGHLSQVWPHATSRIALFVHGLTELESIWDYPRQPGVSYASLLAEEFGITPLFLRYNSGQAIPESGQQLDLILRRLAEHWPVALEEINLVGHSMGGLVIRAACHQGEVGEARWIPHVQRCVYLGSPHQGAPLARLAHHSAKLLRTLPRDYVRVPGEILDLRSQGIRDLQRGRIHPEGHTPAMLASARHYAVSGSLARHPHNPVNWLLGDALVPERSARGLQTLTDHAHFPGIGHIGLTHHSDVYLTLRRWFS